MQAIASGSSVCECVYVCKTHRYVTWTAELAYTLQAVLSPVSIMYKHKLICL